MGIHIRLAGEEIGPFSESQVRQFLGEGLVSPSDLALLDGMSDWQSVETLMANLPPPAHSTPVFSDPFPATGTSPEPPFPMQNDVPDTLEETTPPTAESASSETTKRKMPKIVLQPIAPREGPPASIKRSKTGKTALTIEPPRPTTALPPVVGFVPKERNATKALPKLGQLALKDVPGRIETSPASTPAAPTATPPPAASASFQPPLLSSPSKMKEESEIPGEKSWFPNVFRGIVYLCCGLALVLVGLIAYAVHLITTHPKTVSQPHPVVLPSSPVEKPVADTTPKTSEDFSERGLKRHSTGNLNGALADYDKALDLDPSNLQACYRRALARQLKGNLNGALADYNAVLSVDPTNADAYRNRAYVKQTTGDSDGALADYHQSVVLNPKSPIAYYNVGLIKVKQGDLNGAITAYNYALDLDPKMAIAYYNRGNAKNTEGDVDGAIADYTQAIGLDPKIALAYCNRGFARQTKNDIDGALADYTAALALNPKMGVVYYNRCLIRVQQGDLNGAIDDSTHAIELNSKTGPAYCNRGLAQMGKGNLDEAQADLRKFCELAPRDSGADWARLYLWIIATRQNPKGTADQDLSTALQNDWNSPPEEFSSKIAAFLLGHMRENELIADAASPDPSREPEQYCKAWYFAGMKRLLAGDTKTAITYFQKSVATNQKDYCEHLFAQTELAALGQGAEAAPKASSANPSN